MARLAGLVFFAACATVLAACATAPPPTSSSRLLVAYDDGRPDGAVAFPSSHHEAMMKFELPPGQHRLGRLWVQAASAGTIRWAFYEQDALEVPGKIVVEGTREVMAHEVAAGSAGPWLTEDLSGMPAQTGAIWLGIKRVLGEPTIAASAIDSRHYFVRSDDPKQPLDLLPVKRAPLVRLELAPRNPGAP